VESTSLGLPQLPQAGNPTSLSSLLTGSHTVEVYYQDAQHFRLSMRPTMSETDVIRNGNTLWLWESAKNSVTEFTAAKGAAKHAKPKLPAGPVLTPQQAADEILKAVGKTTTVSMQSNVSVGNSNEPAYQLVLAPKDHRSLIGRVVIAIDAKYGVPLKVQVFARGAGSPAFQVGYTDLSFTAPAAANFRFSPPSGASVDKVNLGTESAQGAGAQKQDSSGFGTYGSDWLTVASMPQQDLLSSLGTAAPGSTAPASTPTGAGTLGGDSQAVISALFAAAKPVSHDGWTGTLLQSSLVSMLMTGGKIYIGAVQPSVLYAAVGHTS
jgi:outer membrane lipoprotein-sorting protein